jgi:hypothetical protein
MTNTRLVCAFAFVSVAVLGCSKKESSDKGAKTDKIVENKSGEKKALTAEFFGKTVAPAGALAKIKWGMSEADARAAAPELFPKPNTDFQLVSDPQLDKVSYGVGTNKDTKKIDRTYIQVPASAAKLLETAWGPGKAAKDTIGRPRTYWFDPATGTRAYLEPGFGEDMNLEFFPYIPAAKLLGEGADTLGFAPQGILGATIEELRTRFPDTIVETDAAKAAADQKKVGNFVGKDLEKELGPASANVRLELPPTEWEQYWTRIQMHWAKDGKVETVYFGLPYAAYPAAKDELKALFEKKWGAPKEEKEFGTAGDPIWVYRAKAPRITVKDDTITHAWDVHVTSKKE